MYKSLLDGLDKFREIQIRVLRDAGPRPPRVQNGPTPKPVSEAGMADHRPSLYKRAENGQVEKSEEGWLEGLWATGPHWSAYNFMSSKSHVTALIYAPAPWVGEHSLLKIALKLRLLILFSRAKYLPRTPQTSAAAFMILYEGETCKHIERTRGRGAIPIQNPTWDDLRPPSPVYSEAILTRYCKALVERFRIFNVGAIVG
ncbi:hypothetical protein BC834DRAFT_848737 [Gloeopeniophorella convolvens]|nr:hypothetical protein BC834DRAFT_848737 [Gloeopeniophorella convolvens]